MTIGLITALYNGYDSLRPLPANHGFDDAVCVTDDPTLEVDGWRMVVFPEMVEDAAVACKFPRCFPEFFLDTDSSVWLDASMALTGASHPILQTPDPLTFEEYGNDKEESLGGGIVGQQFDNMTFKEWAMSHLERADFIALVHPERRNCLYQEGAHCIERLTKYDAYPLAEQLKEYEEEGMPPNFGLWATGYTARKHNSSTHEIGKLWWEQIKKWGSNCQISLPYVLWKLGSSVTGWEVFNNGAVFNKSNLIKFHPYIRQYAHIDFKCKISQPRLWVVDDFYDDPDGVRELALNLQYISNLDIYKGYRSHEVYRPLIIKEAFEKIIGKKIHNWEHSHNGKFQWTQPEDLLVYHYDNQSYAGMVYLAPEAPYECGTQLLAGKTGARTRNDPAIAGCFDGGFYDKTHFKVVDRIGNIYNRLVIFDASCIHSAMEYFGSKVGDARLVHLFFFDA